MKKIWIVTRLENQYDQFGEYFEGVFETEDLCISPNGHWGRANSENTWYHKRHVELNAITHIEDD